MFTDVVRAAIRLAQLKIAATTYLVVRWPDRIYAPIMPRPLTSPRPCLIGYPTLNADLSPIFPATSSPDSAPLRICLLGYRSHPHVGGQGIYLYYLSKALVDAGHNVDVISGQPYPELDSRVRLIKLPSLDLYASPNHVRALRWHHLRSFTDCYEWWTMLTGGFGEPYTFGRRLVKYFRKHGCAYDVVHDNQSLCYGLLTLQKRGVPIMATVHHPITRDRELALAAAPDWGHRLLSKRWYSFLSMQKKVVQRLHHIITVSEQSRRDIALAFARTANRITVIPNGIDTELFKPLADITRDNLQLITTASSDQPLKGLSVLLRALALVRTEFPGLKLLVIGKLKPDGATERELRDLDLQDCVSFVTDLTSKEIVQRYATAAIAVVPSLYEGFGLPACEAMACAVPLVCSDGGALPEVVGDAALIVKAGDVSALADALTLLLSDQHLRATFSAAGRAHMIKQFSWTVVAQQVVNFYRTALAPHTIQQATFSASAIHSVKLKK
jgi:glycosyltransferase involved in cell wall biosynthesis